MYKALGIPLQVI